MSTRGQGDFLRMVSDLDRCPHGRHEGDTCWDCEGGLSLGNPRVRTGEVLAYGLDGRQKYVMPPRGQRHDPDAWLATD